MQTDFTPTAMPDKKRPALLIQHPSAQARLEPPPETDASRAAAEAAQWADRAKGVANLLAHFDGFILATADEHVQAHYMQWGWTAVRGATVGARQWAIQVVGLHAAAQALHDVDRQTDGDFGVDLLQSQHDADKRRYTQLAEVTIRTYLKHLGKVDDTRNDDTFGTRLGVRR